MGDIDISETVVFELDDFQTDEASLFALGELKRRYPPFKATLFAVVGRCDLAKLRELGNVDWLELAVHGLDHSFERRWGGLETSAFLDFVDSLEVCVKLFKSPWNLLPTEESLRVLKERGYRYCTPRWNQLPQLQAAGLEVYLGCPMSRWLHPFQLEEHLKTVSYGSVSEFLFVSEVFDLEEARENNWIWRE